MNKKISIFIYFLLSNTLAASQKPSLLKEALTHACPIIKNYIKEVSPQEKEKFAQYLSYYRSEGGYQAVTPAPYTIRDTLSPHSKALFKKLILYAQPLTQKRKNLPGATSLSKEGDHYFKTILLLLNRY